MENFEIPKAVEAPELPSPEDGHESLVRIEKELIALKEDQLLHIGIDIPRACAVAIGAQPAIRAMRSQIERLPDFPIAVVDQLEHYTRALYYAHLLCAPAPRTNRRLREAYREINTLRAELLEQATALAGRGLMPTEKVEEIRGGSGYFDAANDVIALSLLFRMHWPAVSNKTVIEQADCERADALGRELLNLMGTRMAPAKLAKEEARDRRARCHTLFYRAYDRCRQAVTYLRWDQKDVDVLVPPLHLDGGRKRRRRHAAEEEGAVTEPPAAVGEEAATKL